MADLAQQPGRAYRHRFDGPFFRRLFLGGVRYIPRPVQRLSMPLWAAVFYGLLPEARRRAERNLDQVLGETTALRRRLRSFRLFVHYAQTLTDHYAVHLGWRGTRAESIGRDHLLGAVSRGRGALAVTGHLGMWQLGPFLAEWRGLPPFYLAMAEEPNKLTQSFEERFRSRFRVVYTTDSPFSSLKLLDILRRGSILGMQMDRHTGGKTVPLPFCGRTAWFAIGPAVLARLSGAPLVPNFFVVEPSPLAARPRVLHVIQEPIEVARTADRDADVLDATRRLVAVYEGFVRRYALQWYNFYDFWAPPSKPLDDAGADAPRDDAPDAPAVRAGLAR